MQLARPAFALDPKRFGKGRIWKASIGRPASARFNDDLKLFATTFIAGFLFVSILIG